MVIKNVSCKSLPLLEGDLGISSVWRVDGQSFEVELCKERLVVPGMGVSGNWLKVNFEGDDSVNPLSVDIFDGDMLVVTVCADDGVAEAEWLVALWGLLVKRIVGVIEALVPRMEFFGYCCGMEFRRVRCLVRIVRSVCGVVFTEDAVARLNCSSDDCSSDGVVDDFVGMLRRDAESARVV